MAAEVGTRKQKRDLVTHDLLGGSSAIVSNSDLDLSLKVASGWQAPFQLLKHGTVPLHRAGTQGLHLLPDQGASGLDLKLTGSAAPAASRVVPSGYASVCTLDKVKSALERARRVSPSKAPAPLAGRQRASDGFPLSNSSSSPSSSSSSSITSSSSIKRRRRQEEEEDAGADGCDSSSGAGGLTAAGCPRCLMYVLISKANPRCPRCESHVPVPVLQKRPRIDLNFSL